MTGYVIGSTTSILPSDTVNEAIGKLEYADTLLAPINSPTFTGIPQAPTAAASRVLGSYGKYFR